MLFTCSSLVISRHRPAWRLLPFAALAAHAQQALDNDAVVKLVKSGLGEDLIVQTITASAGKYDVSVEAMIALKQAGVTDKELGAMVTKKCRPVAAPATQTIVIQQPTRPYAACRRG